MKKILIVSIISIFFFAITSCSSVKSYQKVFINDPDMSLSLKKTEVYESNFQTYREAAAGANGGKTGGGCGCN